MKVEETMKLTKMMVWAAAAVLLLTGCQNENHNGFFKGETARDEVNKFGEVQASQGARNDAMLYSYHFTGTHLNSLGRAKVLAMLDNCNDNCDAIVVHMVRCGQDDVLAQRKAAVELYLKTEEGPNALTFHPAADDLLRITKTESGKADGSSDASAADSGSSSAGGASAAPASK